jgi:acyl carrier protein
MSAPNDASAARIVSPRELIRRRVEEILFSRFGRVEEELFLSGLLDSLRMIEFALELETEFGLSIEDTDSKNFRTISTVVNCIIAAGSPPTTRRR